jgi:hypothetical protein
MLMQLYSRQRNAWGGELFCVIIQGRFCSPVLKGWMGYLFLSWLKRSRQGAL